ILPIGIAPKMIRTPVMVYFFLKRFSETLACVLAAVSAIPLRKKKGLRSGPVKWFVDENQENGF
ncbi:MAG TPA: hypothetical protein PKZ34_04120, partial [Thermotogota bacterium]|nr:hypothetical protein [Thermotogota bacterium]